MCIRDRTLFDNYLVDHIAEETNKYYRFVKSKLESTEAGIKLKSKLHNWRDTNVSEIYTLIATVLLMGQIKKNRLHEYWTADPLFSIPMFGKIFSQDRFFLLFRMLHFNNNLAQIAGDKLLKITTIFETLRKKFKNSFNPSKNLSIDESLVLWKGRLSFRQYIPSKRHKFGIKMFVLCDCKTGYILDFILYTGSDTNIDNDKNLGMTGSVVLTLLEPYLNRGHEVYVDNWYTSPTLFQYLYENGTGACGTAKINRKHMPHFQKRMKKGDYSVKHTGILLAEKWDDKRDVIMLSTICKPEMVETNKIDRITGLPVKKPMFVVQYNTNMGLVDKSYMQMSFTDSTCKTLKWY